MEILLQNRVHLYQILHTVFSGEPNEELIHQLAGEATSMAFEILSEEDDDMMAKMSGFVKKLEAKLAEVPAEGESTFMDAIKNGIKVSINTSSTINIGVIRESLLNSFTCCNNVFTIYFPLSFITCDLQYLRILCHKCLRLTPTPLNTQWLSTTFIKHKNGI